MKGGRDEEETPTDTRIGSAIEPQGEVDQHPLYRYEVSDSRRWKFQWWFTTFYFLKKMPRTRD